MREELFTYDNLAVAVKADAADEIKTAYCTLGWRLEDEYGDDSYGDIIHMDFVRPHFIRGKDRLQLLQVRYEVALNFIARAHRRVGARAAAVAALLIIVGLSLAGFGAYCIVSAPSPVFVGGGIALAVAGAAFFAIAAYAGRTLLARDRVRCASITAILSENISAILSEAAHITGAQVSADESSGAAQ